MAKTMYSPFQSLQDEVLLVKIYEFYCCFGNHWAVLKQQNPGWNITSSQISNCFSKYIKQKMDYFKEKCGTPAEIRERAGMNPLVSPKKKATAGFKKARETPSSLISPEKKKQKNNGTTVGVSTAGAVSTASTASASTATLEAPTAKQMKEKISELVTKAKADKTKRQAAKTAKALPSQPITRTDTVDDEESEGSDDDLSYDKLSSHAPSQITVATIQSTAVPQPTANVQSNVELPANIRSTLAFLLQPAIMKGNTFYRYIFRNIGALASDVDLDITPGLITVHYELNEFPIHFGATLTNPTEMVNGLRFDVVVPLSNDCLLAPIPEIKEHEIDDERYWSVLVQRKVQESSILLRRHGKAPVSQDLFNAKGSSRAHGFADLPDWNEEASEKYFNGPSPVPKFINSKESPYFNGPSPAPRYNGKEFSRSEEAVRFREGLRLDAEDSKRPFSAPRYNGNEFISSDEMSYLSRPSPAPKHQSRDRFISSQELSHSSRPSSTPRFHRTDVTEEQSQMSPPRQTHSSEEQHVKESAQGGEEAEAGPPKTLSPTFPDGRKGRKRISLK